MTRLNRPLQLELLNTICDAYPHPVTTKIALRAAGDPDVLRSLMYLSEHKLIEVKASTEIGSRKINVMYVRATEKGMDFLEQDGGLTAILGVLTVRLHQDTIRELMEARITGSDLPHEEKETLLEKLRQLPAQSIERLADKLLDQALTKAPDAIEWISTLLRLS